MADRGEFFFRWPEYDEKATKKNWKPDLVPCLEELVKKIGALPDGPDVEQIENILRETAEAHEVKMRVFAQAVRVALSGGTVSPPLDRMIRILGKDESVKRLEFAIERMRGMEAS
jgi:glutamyl-tRNA synthetase